MLLSNPRLAPAPREDGPPQEDAAIGRTRGPIPPQRPSILALPAHLGVAPAPVGGRQGDAPHGPGPVATPTASGRACGAACPADRRLALKRAPADHPDGAPAQSAARLALPEPCGALERPEAASSSRGPRWDAAPSRATLVGKRQAPSPSTSCSPPREATRRRGPPLLAAPAPLAEVTGSRCGVGQSPPPPPSSGRYPGGLREGRPARLVSRLRGPRPRRRWPSP